MRPHAYHGVYATLRCNLSCECCIRNESDAARGLELSLAQIRQSLEETAFFSTEYQVHKVFTGGEPTLWREGDTTICDVMVYAAQLGYLPHLVTNGRVFRTADDTSRFMESYLMSTDTPLEITLSADLWHGNTDPSGRCLPLDNLLDFRIRRNIPSSRLSVAAEWTCSVRGEDLPSADFVSNYEGLVDTIVLFPVAPCGRGRRLSQIAPKLSPGGRSKAQLGAFLEAMKRRSYASGWADCADSFETLSNEEIMNQCSVGDSTLCLYADGGYYACPEGAGDPLFRICGVGELSAQVIDDFFRSNPAFRLHRELGPIGFLRRFAEDASEVQSVMSDPFPFGVSGRTGCAIHRRLIEMGMFQRVNSSGLDVI